MFDSPHPAAPDRRSTTWGSPRSTGLKLLRPAKVAVALPGSGSDADFARRAFGPACASYGLELIAVEPNPLGVIVGYRAALDTAAEDGPVLVAGISLGAAIAVEWAADNPESVAGVIAALPAWTGPATAECPAARSAVYTADQLSAEGLEPVIARMRSGSPVWLADALTQSWRAQWPHLPHALREAASYRWPDAERLGSTPVPVAVVAAIDDAVHPLVIAEEWAGLIPGATLHRITLDALGADPAIIGRLGLAAFDHTE